MKKIRFLSLILAMVLLIGSVPFAALATDIPADDVLETVPETTLEPITEAPQTEYAFGSVSILNGCRTLDSMVPLGGSDRKLPTTQAAMVYERDTGTMIYAYNPDMKLSPGSLTKLVTALVVLERCEDLDEVITVGEGLAGRIPGGAQAGVTITVNNRTRNLRLKTGEALTIDDLLHFMIMQNAADAAAVLAEHIAGNQKAFVELMNARVQQIGCINTTFGNVHGYDNVTQYTTARDMSRFMMEATKNEKFCTLIADQSYKVPDVMIEDNKIEMRDSGYTFASQNYLMETTIVPKYNYRYVTGGMGSYSGDSGAGLVCTADSSTESKKGLDVICVLLGASREFAENGWTVLNYGNFDEMITLLEYVYNNYKVNRVLFEGQALEQFPVAGGECEVVGQPKVNIDTVLPADAQMTNLIRNRHVANGGLTAPIGKGEMISTIELWYRNSCIAEAELFAMEEVRTAADSGLKIRSDLSASGAAGTTATRVVLIVSLVILVPVLGYLGYNSFLRRRIRAQRRRRRKGRRRSY